MIYVAIIVAASCFMAAIRLLAIPPIAAGVVGTTRSAAAVLRDRAMSDDEKERLMQRASLTLMRAFASLTARLAAAIAISLLPLLALHAAGVVQLSAVGELLGSWEGTAVTTAAMTAMYCVKLRP